MPDSAEKCISSWKKYCPDYEIKRWDESNFDINCCDYVREAYQARKWAFVSDYARFKILFEKGGVYFDTDVEVIKPIDDIVRSGPFMGYERYYRVAPGLGIGAEPGMTIIKELLDGYQNKHFLKTGDYFDYPTVVEYTSEVFFRNGLKRTSGIQEVAGIKVYPQDYFCPFDGRLQTYDPTENTVSIHRFDSSWRNKSYSIVKYGKRIMGKELTKKICDLIDKKHSSI